MVAIWKLERILELSFWGRGILGAFAGASGFSSKMAMKPVLLLRIWFWTPKSTKSQFPDLFGLNLLISELPSVMLLYLFARLLCKTFVSMIWSLLSGMRCWILLPSGCTVSKVSAISCSRLIWEISAVMLRCCFLNRHEVPPRIGSLNSALD